MHNDRGRWSTQSFVVERGGGSEEVTDCDRCPHAGCVCAFVWPRVEATGQGFVVAAVPVYLRGVRAVDFLGVAGSQCRVFHGRRGRSVGPSANSSGQPVGARPVVFSDCFLESGKSQYAVRFIDRTPQWTGGRGIHGIYSGAKYGFFGYRLPSILWRRVG